MTVFEKVKTMNKDEFSEFCSMLYSKAWHDGTELVDDEGWVRVCLADTDYDYLMENLE